MEIREQVAEQLSADLQQIAAENARLQEDYQYEVKLCVEHYWDVIWQRQVYLISPGFTAAVKRCGYYFETHFNYVLAKHVMSPRQSC